MRNAATIITVLGVVTVGLSACGQDKSVSSQTTATTTTPTPSMAPPPPPPAPAAPEPSAADKLAAQLQDMGAARTAAGDVIQCSSAEFESGQSYFAPTDPTRVEKIAQLMRDNPQVHVMINGYTDSKGTSAANRQLSEQRAEAVKQSLVQRGVDGSRIDTRGMGEEHPLASNDTAEGRAQNRRVEAVFSDVYGRFASTESEDNRG